MFKRIQYSGFISLIVLLFVITPFSTTFAQDYAEGRVIVKLKEDVEQSTQKLRSRVSVTQVHRFGLINAEVWQLGSGVSVQEAIDRLSGNAMIEYAEPDYKVHAIGPEKKGKSAKSAPAPSLIPNDTYFDQLWGMHNTGQTGGTVDADIDAPEAWDTVTGDSIVIGIIDTGIDYNHEDLQGNIWTNPGEIPDNGVDDDNNGYVDDVHGYDFVNEDGDPFDDNGHGTHVGGTIAAEGNNGTGVAGVNWSAKLAGLKFLDSGGSGFVSDAIEAVEYADMEGIPLSNNSWGGGGYSQSLRDAIEAAGQDGHLFIAAAGNDGRNIDDDPQYPASYSLNNVVAVASSDHNDNMSSFSNYGPTSVDLAAPGTDIYSTLPNNDYGTLSGTSMATPHVVGAASLVMSENPGFTNVQVKNRLMASTDFLPAFDGLTVSEGRLNLQRAVSPLDSIPPAMVTDLSADSVKSTSLTLNWTATGDDSLTGTAAAYDIRFSTSPIDSANFADMPQVDQSLQPDSAGSLQSLEVTELDFNTTYYFAIKVVDEWGNTSMISNVVNATTQGIPELSFSPDSLADSLEAGQTSVQTMSLSNTGNGVLEFSFPGFNAMQLLENTPEIQQNQQKESYVEVNLSKGEKDPREGNPVVLGAGGPDEFGHRWIDSDESGGPQFVWDDISGEGTEIFLGDDDYKFVDLPFNVSFYGTEYSGLYISSNGIVTFGQGTSALTNDPIPDGSTPNNFIAPFWDDLDPSSGGAIYYHIDDQADKITVQYTDVPHYGDPVEDHYTFQVVISADGNYTFYFDQMLGVLNSSTLGIEDSAATDGLQVAFNTSYVHDSLAVSILRPVDFISDISPSQGDISSGGQTSVDVTFDATETEPGQYSSSVQLNSNDPDEGTSFVPADLEVTTGPAAIELRPDTLNFGEVVEGISRRMSYWIVNTGGQDVDVSSITSSNTDFAFIDTSDTGPFTVPFGDSTEVEVRFTPSTTGSIIGEMEVNSNASGDSVETLIGEGLPAPEIAVTPDSLSETLAPGDSSQQILTVSNNGGSQLEFTISAGPQATTYNRPFKQGGNSRNSDNTPISHDKREDVNALQRETLVIQDNLAWGVDMVNFIDTVFGFVPSHITSDQIASTNFDNYEVIITAGDQSQSYYDALSNNVTKFEEFLNQGGIVQYQVATQGPDVDLAGGVNSIHGNLEDYNDVINPDHPITEGLPLELLGDAANHNEILNLPADANVLTVTRDTDDPTTAVYEYGNGKVVATGMTWSFLYEWGYDAGQILVNATEYSLGVSTADWLSLSTRSDTVQPGSSVDITATFDATDIDPGLYTQNISFSSNDVDRSPLDVPASLDVEGVPNISLSTDSIDYGDVFIGDTAERIVEITNVGSDSLHINDLVVGNSDYTIDHRTQFTIMPETTESVPLLYHPQDVGSDDDSLTITSNDPDESTVNVSLFGLGEEPPVIAVSPDSLSETLAPGDSVQQTLTVSNTGQSDLEISSINVTDHFLAIRDRKAGQLEGEVNWMNIGSGPTSGETNSKKSLDPRGYTWTPVNADTTDDPQVLVYADDWVHTAPNTYPDQALQSLGISYTAYYGGAFASFESDLTSGSWDLVIFANDNANPPTSTLDDLHNYVENGGRLIAHSWVADNGHALWNELGFAHMANKVSPDSVFEWGESAYFNDVPSFTKFNDVTAQVYGQRGDTVGNVQAIGGYTMVPQLNEAAMITQNGGKTIFKGTIDAHIEGDKDNDGTTDMVEFWKNMINNVSTSWLTVQPTSDTVAPGNSAEFTVTFDATELNPGFYIKNLSILSNDFDRSPLDVPASLDVEGEPNISLSIDSLDYGDVFIGDTAERFVEITNVGSDSLHINDLVTSNDDYTVDHGAQFTLLPDSSEPVPVMYHPQEAAGDNDTLTISSNDPDESTLHVALFAQGEEPPVMAVTPDSMSTTLRETEKDTLTLNVDNSDGGSELTYSINIRSGAAAIDKRSSIAGKDGRGKTYDGLGGEPNLVKPTMTRSSSSFEAELPDEVRKSATVDTLPFTDGFESGNLDRWFIDGANGPKVVVDSVSSVGNYSFYHDNESEEAEHFDGIHKEFASGSQPGYISFYVRSNSTETHDSYFVLYDNGVGSVIWFYARGDGQFYVNADLNGDASVSYEVKRWYHVEFRDIDWEAKTFDYYVNGDLIKEDILFRRSEAAEEMDFVFLHNFSPDAKAWWDHVQIGHGRTDWISLETRNDTIPAGSSQQIDTYIDPSGLSPGEYRANLMVNSNDPINSSETVPVDLKVVDFRVVDLNLNPGWNLRSFNVTPEQDSTHRLLSPIMDSLDVVLGYDDEGLTFDPEVPLDQNTLHTMGPTGGYWFRMRDSASINIGGISVNETRSFDLDQGFNLISYLPQQPDSIEHALSSISDKIEVVLGFEGGGVTYDPSIPSEFNSLLVLKPTYGYWVKLSDSADFSYPEEQAFTEKQKGQVLARAAKRGSKMVNPTREWVNIWSSDLTLRGTTIKKGSSVIIKDQEGNVAGYRKVSETGKLPLTAVYRDNPSTKVDEGAEPDEWLTLVVKGQGVEFKVSEAFKWSSQGDVIDLTQKATGLDNYNIPDKYSLKQNYPNPFNPTTKIKYSIPEHTQVKINVYNVLGQRVATLINKKQKAGYYTITFDASRLASGTYLYRIQTDDFVKTRKMVLIK